MQQYGIFWHETDVSCHIKNEAEPETSAEHTMKTWNIEVWCVSAEVWRKCSHPWIQTSKELFYMRHQEMRDRDRTDVASMTCFRCSLCVRSPADVQPSCLFKEIHSLAPETQDFWTCSASAQLSPLSSAGNHLWMSRPFSLNKAASS